MTAINRTRTAARPNRRRVFAHVRRWIYRASRPPRRVAAPIQPYKSE
ncbi:MAG: hypothetical protein AB7U73_03710 [Pirellulales bacterium]